MNVHVEVLRVDDTARDVGAVVGGAFEVGQEVRPDKAGFHTAILLLQAENVLGAHMLLEAVDDLLQGLHAVGGVEIGRGERGQCQLQNFLYRAGEGLQLSLCPLGEDNLLFRQLLCRLHQIDGVVGNAFEISDDLKQLRRLCAVALADLSGTHFHQIRADNILVVVGFVLGFAHGLGKRGIELVEALQTVFQGCDRAVCHIDRKRTATLQCDRGGGEQTLVQLGDFLGLFGVGNQSVDQFFKQ